MVGIFIIVIYLSFECGLACRLENGLDPRLAGGLVHRFDSLASGLACQVAHRLETEFHTRLARICFVLYSSFSFTAQGSTHWKYNTVKFINCKKFEPGRDSYFFTDGGAISKDWILHGVFIHGLPDVEFYVIHDKDFLIVL